MTLSADDVTFVGALVQRRSAIQIDATKAYLVESRIGALARELGFTSEGELLTRLRRGTDPRLSDKVVDAMTTNETLFFRDIHPFDTLRTTIFPELFKQRQAHVPVNVWSAASSTGQEAYSIALLLCEHFPGLPRDAVRIVGTDLSARVLEIAKMGRYSQAEVNRGLPATMLVKHFKQDRAQWQLSEAVRGLVEFRPLNLVEPWPLSTQFDVVMLRYVLVYFDPPTRVRVLDKVRRQMKVGGYLFLGAAEIIDPEVKGFERLTFGRTTVFRRVADDEPRRVTSPTSTLR